MNILARTVIGPPVAKDKFLPVVQFSLLLDCKTPSLCSLLKLLASGGISILAVSFLENFETSIIRCVVNYPGVARRIFAEKTICFHETKVLGVELQNVDEIGKLTNAIFAAELKICYMYSFLIRPGGQVGLVVQTENNEFAANVLGCSGIRTISQHDIGR
jgi:hypothetical protein